MNKFKTFINGLGRAKPDTTTNPYTKPGISSHITDDRYMNLAISKRNWQIVVIGLLAANLVQAMVLGYVAVHSKIETRVALVNNGMVTDTLRTDDLTPTEKEKLIKVFLERFIMDSRQVSTDEALEKRALDMAYGRVSGEAATVLTEWHHKNNPLDLAAKFTTSVEIVNTLEMKDKPNTWQIIWDETRRSLDGQVIDITRYVGQLTYKITNPDSKNAKINPFGIYIVDLTWSPLN